MFPAIFTVSNCDINGCIFSRSGYVELVVMYLKEDYLTCKMQLILEIEAKPPSKSFDLVLPDFVWALPLLITPPLPPLKLRGG